MTQDIINNDSIAGPFGPVIPNSYGSRRLQPNGSAKPWVSEYYNFGSYSGVDAEVVVHLPYSAKVRSNQLARINLEIQEAEDNRDTALSEGATLSFERAIRELKYLYNEKSKIEKHDPRTVNIGNMQTLSVSIFREKFPKRTLGSVYPKAYARGARTIGGSMIFTIFRTTVLYDILKQGLNYYSTGQMDRDIYADSTILIDQLPPLDMSIRFANEYGSVSHIRLWGVEFMQEGSTYSVEDIYSETTVQYVCRDYDPLEVKGERLLEDSGIAKKWSAKTASSLTLENAHVLRRNPFI